MFRLPLRVLITFFALGLGLASAQTAKDYLASANKLYAAKDYDKALQYYKAAAKLDPNNASLYQGMGNCYYGKGDKKSALAQYEKALDLNPNNSQLASFVDKLKGQVGQDPGLPSLDPMDSASGTDLSATASKPAPSADEQEDSKKYNQWNSGHSYTKNMVEVYLGPVILEGGSIGFDFGSGYYFPATKGLFVGVAQTMSITSGDTWDPYYGTGTFTQFDFETILLVKYKFEGQIRPMIFGGGGLNTRMTMYSSSYYDFDYGFFPEVTAGGGVDFQLGNDVSLFAQARFALFFGNGGTATSIPIEIGFAFPTN